MILLGLLAFSFTSILELWREGHVRTWWQKTLAIGGLALLAPIVLLIFLGGGLWPS
jgi:hypothetical protein